MLPLLVCAAFFSLTSAYSIPDPQFEVLKPSGLKVSIPNEEGIQAFSFHGNVNQELKGLEPGQISQDVSANQNGKFTVYDENVNLQNGDVINYWLLVTYKGLGYQLDNGKYVYQESNLKNSECPPGYKKKAVDRDAPKFDEITAWSSSDHDEIAGSDGLNNYHRNYQHGFRPNIYYGRPWYPFYPRGHWHHFNGPRRGRGHNRWHSQNHNYHYNRFDLNDAPILQGGTDIPETEHILTLVRRNADSEEEDKNESGDVQLESRFGGFSHGSGGANFIYPFRPTHKPYRAHGYRFHGHGYDHRRDYDHGYGFYPGHHRPHGPPHRPYPVGPHPGFGKDHHKFDDYYDCEEDDSNENEKPSESTNSEATTSTAKPFTKAPEVPSSEEPPITSPISSTTTTTTTTTTTERTSTFPQIDIRFGDS